ncbi:ATP-binding protein [Prauserella halophila]|uniref:ATP-binding protein n=1 Tax=Prauserella halophila TaxID=185641 RepID=A0ABP4GNV8_9PSEU|nr:sigma 54-interacting transcriptional regulator [Prauserella halophila]MCP2237172.1 magnesium chelatase subunit I [Prauserella halophila]
MNVSEETAPADLPRTAGELRAAGHEPRGVKDEIAANLLTALREGRDPWPGIVGFGATVVPQLERALLAGHDVALLGERGQGKTRLLRTLGGLLDEWTPVIEGSELAEHPLRPITPASLRRAAELGDDLPVRWWHRSHRYTEKLATPDTSVGDLIGDVDPVKVAEGRPLGDPETIHFGLVPRAHRGIVAVNELPDLAERIQVALLNVMEERDIQVRGYTLRLPLDVLLVATANPEDYTNRGRIITPLKDRFGAEIRTHYPAEVEAEIDLVRQEADLVAEVGDPLVEVLARLVRSLREATVIDQRSGVSARFAVAAAETVAAAALRRAALTGEEPAVARPVDLESVPEVLRGKLEFEPGEEGRELEQLVHLLRVAVAETARTRFAGLDLTPLADAVTEGRPVETGERVRGRELLAVLPELPVLHEVAERCGAGPDDAAARIAAAVELALESLYLGRKVAKDVRSPGDGADARTVYGS